jgi:hypothetical protein
MDKNSKIPRPAGDKRQIAGLVILCLGGLIWVRVAWLFAFYRAGFGHDEWIRFAFWVWVGAVLGLTGCWLRYRSRLAGWGAAAAVPAFFALVALLAVLGL